jgi:TorA maturation chaperone TorD
LPNAPVLRHPVRRLGEEGKQGAPFEGHSLKNSSMGEAKLELSVSEEDVLRANLYRLLATTLRAGPSRHDLDMFADMHGDDTPIGQAVSTITRVAAKSGPEEVSREFHDLFIGVGRGELVPYGSYYLTGFLHEKPLARLRNDMARLGIERRDDVAEPEDHIAALCEMMAGLIVGDFGEVLDLDEQKKFFQAHIASWAKHFFTDLEGARSSVFYACIGQLGAAFMDVEDQAFLMV